MSVPHSRTASSSDETRRHIISSIFPPRDEDGIPEETLISYVKVYEEEAGSPEGGAKTRYLMLAGRSTLKLVIMSLIWRSVTKFGKVVIHKAKRNNNLSFSKGKTWQLEDMRVLEVVGVR
jgi:hypothetical protein